MSKVMQGGNVPKLRDYPKYQDVAERVAELEGELRAAQGAVRVAGETDQLAVTARADRERRGEAVFRGEDPEVVVGPTPEEMKELHARVSELEAGIRHGRQKLGDMRHEVSREICDEIRPAYLAMMERVAGCLVDLSEAVEGVFLFRNELEAGGVEYSGYLPQIFLDPFRASDAGSRSNLLLSEIQRDLGIKVERPSMEAQQKREHDVAVAEGKRQEQERKERERERKAAIQRAQEAAAKA